MAATKVMELDDAVATFVRPRHAVYFTTDAVAAVRSMVRMLAGSDPRLTVMCLRAGASHCGELLEAGLAAKLIAASFGTQHPAFRPSPLLGRAYAKGAVAFEFWSLLSLVQRFQAAAQGMPFLPTRSLRGSSMAALNTGAYLETADPFSGAPVSLVTPLRPDICFIKAAAADPQGNAIVCPPFEDDMWPSRAASLGCIVVAENLVSREFLQERAQLVNVPASKVLAVCHVPHASHPQSFAVGLPLGLEIEGYAVDLAAYEEYDKATSDPAAFAQWTERHVTGVRSHAAYLDGAKRPHAPARRRGDPATPAATSDADRTVLACGWLVAQLAAQRGYAKLLVGVGQAQAAAGVATQLLRSQGKDITLLEGTGKVDFKLPPGTRTPTAPVMLSGTTDVYSTLVGDAAADCVAILGAAEIDRFGNINSTLARGRLMVGSGGLNDAVSLAASVIVVMKADPRKMVERCDYVTAPGAKVEFLVTDEAILRKGPDGAFEIYRWFLREPGEAADAGIARARENCPWNLAISREAEGLHLMALPCGAATT